MAILKQRNQQKLMYDESDVFCAALNDEWASFVSSGFMN